jgi:hypothetical protein
MEGGCGGLRPESVQSLVNRKLAKEVGSRDVTRRAFPRRVLLAYCTVKWQGMSNSSNLTSSDLVAINCPPKQCRPVSLKSFHEKFETRYTHT